MPTPDPLAAVLAANHQFYQALSLADFAAMQNLWLPSPDAVCLHPGWPPIHGWAAIRDSWRGIFEHQGPLHVWPSEEQVRLYPLTAEVVCWENVEMGQVAGAGVVQTRATNVFRLVNTAWKMLEHHALPMRGTQAQKPERFSQN